MVTSAPESAVATGGADPAALQVIDVDLHPVDGKLLAGFEGPIHRVGNEAVGANFQTAAVTVHPSAALKRSADDYRLRAQRDRRAGHGQLGSNVRIGRHVDGHAMGDGVWYLSWVVIGNVEEHDGRRGRSHHHQ